VRHTVFAIRIAAVLLVRGTWSHTFDLIRTIHGAGGMGMKVAVR
jgi:hypothetical protein